MSKKEEKKEEEVFYVGIRDPAEIRRSILESSKEMLQYLQRFEKFKEVRSEKESMIVQLKEDIKNIQNLVRKLKQGLPKSGVRAKTHKVSKKKAKAKKEKPAKVVVEEEPVVEEKPKEMTELEKLEGELEDIEGRLTKLA